MAASSSTARPGRLERGRVRAEVGIEVLEPQELRVARRVGGVTHPVDADPGHTSEARDGHGRDVEGETTGVSDGLVAPCPVPTSETGTPSASSTKCT